MAKGSQLKQLKSALQQAGLTQQPQAGKKRKRAAPTERDKEKKAARLQDIQQKLNPFDVKVTKVKHDVGGRKITGTTGRPAQSKQAGIEQVRKYGLEDCYICAQQRYRGRKRCLRSTSSEITPEVLSTDGLVKMTQP